MPQSDAQIIDDDVLSALDKETKDKEAELNKSLDRTTDNAANDDNDIERIRAELEKARRESRLKDEELKQARKYSSETTTKLADETHNRIQAEEVAITNAIAASVTEAERLENEIVAAQEAGRFADAAKLTRQLASAQTKIDSWEARKEQFEGWKEQQKNAKPAQQPQYPKSQAWIAAHPEFNTNPQFHNKVMAAHYAAQAEGIVIDSDDYIAYIDDAVAGKRQANNDSGAEPTYDSVRGQGRSSKTAAAAPPSRGNNTMGNSNKRGDGGNRLTPEQAEVAQLTFPKLKASEAQKKYWESRQILQEQNKLGGD